MARVTQRDIARILGVSQATISMVLSGDEAKIKRIPIETRKKIERVIKEQGYVVDPIARRMSKSNNKILGIFTYESAFQSQTRDFFAPFLLGIEKASHELGYDILLLTGAGAETLPKKILDSKIRLRLADGCLILGEHIDYSELAKLHATDYPFVAIGRREGHSASAIPYIGADTYNATKDCVAHVLSLGHTRLAYVGPQNGSETDSDRWKGFNDALTKKVNVVARFPDTRTDAEGMLEAFVTQRASVVFCRNIEDAILLEKRARQRGMTLPKALSFVVLGSHRHHQAQKTFTSFIIPREEMGYKAVQMLVAMLEKTIENKQWLVPCAFVAGDTLAAFEKQGS